MIREIEKFSVLDSKAHVDVYFINYASVEM